MIVNKKIATNDNSNLVRNHALMDANDVIRLWRHSLVVVDMF